MINRSSSKDACETVWFEVQDDALDAGIQKGDYVKVRVQPEVEDGDIALIVVAGKPMVRRCARRPEPDTSSAFLITPDPGDQHSAVLAPGVPEVVGKVIAVSREVVNLPPDERTLAILEAIDRKQIECHEEGPDVVMVFLPGVGNVVVHKAKRAIPREENAPSRS